MTNDYKANLLEYLTGNMTEQVESANPLYVETTQKEYEYGLIPYYQVRCKDGNGNYNGKVLYYQRLGSQITLVDENMDVLKTFTTFSSGTSLGNILNIEIDEVGNAYGLDFIEVNDTRVYRIILLNNISEIPKGYNDYQVILRNSYYVQGYSAGDDINPQYETFLAKSTQSATYYFALQEGTGSLIMPSLFQINVGAENTWTRLPDLIFSNGNVDIGNIYFDTNDQPVAEYIGTERITEDWEISRGIAIGSNNPTYDTVLSDIMANYYHSPIADNNSFTITLLANYYGSFYMILNGRYKSGTSGGVDQYKSKIATYLIKGSEVKNLFEKEPDIVLPLSTSYPSVGKGLVLDNVLLMYVGLPIDSNGNLKIYFNLLADENKINYLTDTGQTAKWTNLNIARIGAFNTYNLYNFSVIYSNDNVRYILNNKAIYNGFNYNGEKYEDRKELIPRQGLLFNSDNSLLFARNLYNLKVYNNQTMATLNVPYNLLNDTTIVEQSLYGETNYELVENTQALNKNVYEDLYINFINALKMTNENTDMVISNMPGAIRLNQSVSKILDYENAKASKIRVTYDDDTSYVTSASNTINNGVCTYSIGVHVPSDTNIQKIEIISNDEATTYQTISNLNLENNKYYVITQDVHVV